MDMRIPNALKDKYVPIKNGLGDYKLGIKKLTGPTPYLLYIRYPVNNADVTVLGQFSTKEQAESELERVARTYDPGTPDERMSDWATRRRKGTLIGILK